jgi:hypothetical protein
MSENREEIIGFFNGIKDKITVLSNNISWLIEEVKKSADAWF